MDILDKQGKTVHYSNSWEKVTTFTGGLYEPGKSFRLYLEQGITLVIKGNEMNKSDAQAIYLGEGYHNFVCDAIIESGSDALVGVWALF